MRALWLTAMVVSMLVANAALAWHFGAKSVKCPPCIEQAAKQCPAEDIYVNTSVGIMHFEAGEIDACPPYIKNKQQMDELYEKLEQEILKQRGKAS